MTAVEEDIFAIVINNLRLTILRCFCFVLFWLMQIVYNKDYREKLVKKQQMFSGG